MTDQTSETQAELHKYKSTNDHLTYRSSELELTLTLRVSQTGTQSHPPLPFFETDVVDKSSLL